MLKTAAVVSEEEQLILSTVSPGAAQKRLAACRRARIVDRFRSDHRRAAWEHPDQPSGCIRSGLCNGDVRLRFDHGDFALCPVFHSALARHPRHREWISFHSAHPHSLDPGVSRSVYAKRWTHWRFADHVVAVLRRARGPSCVRDRLCLVEGYAMQTNGSGRARQVRRSP